MQTDEKARKIEGTEFLCNTLLQKISFLCDEVDIELEKINKNVRFSLHDEEELVIYLHNRSKYKLRLFFDGKKYQMQYANIPEEGYSNGFHKVRWAVRSVFEFAVDFADLGYKPGDEVTIIVTVVKRGLEVRHYSHITFIVPDENYEKEMWSL